MTSIINTLDIEKARKMIREAKSKPIIVKAQDNEFNRKILEYGKFDILLDVESGSKKDSLKQMDSGLNEIIARIATKNNITIGLDLKEISNLDKKQKAITLARSSQNLKILRKTKTKLKALNYKDKIDVFSLLLSLGASSQQAKQAF